MGKRYEIREIKKVKHKHCNGPMHPGGGAWVPVRNFKKRSDNQGRLRGNCSACEHYFRYHKPAKAPLAIGYTNVSNFTFAIRELESKLGRMEAIRRTGIGKTTWFNWLNGKRTRMLKLNAVKLIATLHEVRKEKIVRHRASIRRGAAARGEPERVPNRDGHFYTQTGDEPNLKRNRELKRDTRKKHAA